VRKCQQAGDAAQEKTTEAGFIEAALIEAGFIEADGSLRPAGHSGAT
jgi:hypothetical protein